MFKMPAPGPTEDENVTSQILSETTAEAYEDNEQIVYLENLIEVNIYIYIPPFILVFGIMGNIISFLVFSMKHNRQSVTALLFRFLAIYDMISLIQAVEFVFFLWDIETLSVTPLACQLSSFIRRTFKTLSAWTLTYIGLERFFGVLFPLKANVLITKRRVLALMAFSIFTVVVLYVPIGWLFSTKKKFNPYLDREVGACTRSKTTIPLYSEIFSWLEPIIYSIVPFCILLFCNISISVRLLMSSRWQQASRHGAPPAASNTRNLTALLMVTSTSFIVLTLPDTIYYLLKTLIGFSSSAPGYSLYVRMRPFKAIGRILQLANHSINILLYCTTGTRFRQDVRTILCGCVGKKQEVSSSSNVTNQSKVENHI